MSSDDSPIWRPDTSLTTTLDRRQALLQIKQVALISAATSPAILLSAGCATPRVNLQSALLQKLTSRMMQVGLNFSLYNPNSYALPLQGLSWKLDLFSKSFTNGSVNFSRQIPAQRTIEALVPIGINIANLIGQIQALLTRKTIPWAFQGECIFRAPTGPIGGAFALDGSWPNPLSGGKLPIPTGRTNRRRRRRRR